MENSVSTVIETIVNTLLQVGDRVVEVSGDEVICGIWEKTDGLGGGSEDYVGRKVKELGNDDVLSYCGKAIAESFRTGKNTCLEQAVKINGIVCLYGVRVLPIHPDKSRLFVVCEQLKEKGTNQAEQDRPDAPHPVFHEHILNSISADIVVLDNQYRFVYINPSSIRDEETRKWLIGKTDEDFFAFRNKPLNVAERRKSMYEAARNERRVIEWVEKSVGLLGEIVHMLRRIYPIFDDKGNLDIIIGYSMNVTEMIAVQEELKMSKDVFESAFRDSGIGMAMLSPDGKWLDVNEVICEMTGYAREELMNLHLRDITHPDDRTANKELVKKMLRRELTSYTLERRYISKQGKIVYALFTLSLVWSKDEHPKFFIAQAVDITKMKDLELENARKNAELEAAKGHLLNKVNQLEELSYLIAHNLRGPAGNIKLLTEALLAKNDSGKLSGAFTTEEGLTYISEASTSLMNSLSSLMKIAEIKLNKNVPVNECDVRAVVNEVTTQLQSAIYEKQAVIKLELEVDVIHYPKAYLESILYNFISNALKYNKPGVPPDIKITTSQNGDKVQLSVKDNGLGIDMERHGEKMFKLNQVFHSGQDSKGFGLYLTKTQVESLGGTIAVESRINEGSVFVVTL